MQERGRLKRDQALQAGTETIYRADLPSCQEPRVSTASREVAKALLSIEAITILRGSIGLKRLPAIGVSLKAKVRAQMLM